MNVCLFIGRLTRDVEVRYVGSGSAVANFSLAINNRYKKNNEVIEDTVFVDFEAWGDTAEFIGKYFVKGNVMQVMSSAKNHEWEDKTTGAKRTQLRFKVDKVNFVPGTKSGDKDSEPKEPASASGDGGGSDVPF